MPKSVLLHTDQADQLWVNALGWIESGEITPAELCAKLEISNATLYRRLARARQVREDLEQAPPEPEPDPDLDAPILRPVFAADSTIPLSLQTCRDIHPDADVPAHPKECCMACNHSRQDWRWEGLPRTPPPDEGEAEALQPADDGSVFTLAPKDDPSLKGGQG